MNIENFIVISAKEILKRPLTLERKDQISISQEFKEWIYGVTNEEKIWFLNHQINKYEKY